MDLFYIILGLNSENSECSENIFLPSLHHFLVHKQKFNWLSLLCAMSSADHSERGQTVVERGHPMMLCSDKAKANCPSEINWLDKWGCAAVCALICVCNLYSFFLYTFQTLTISWRLRASPMAAASHWSFHPCKSVGGMSGPDDSLSSLFKS